MNGYEYQFQKAAAQRLNAAEVLFKNDLTLDSQYLAGYTIECALKALIVYHTRPQDRTQKLAEITRGAKWHNPEKLIEELKHLGISFPLRLVKRIRRFPWTPALRYPTGRFPIGETKGLLKTAKAIYDWVEGQLR